MVFAISRQLGRDDRQEARLVETAAPARDPGPDRPSRPTARGQPLRHRSRAARHAAVHGPGPRRLPRRAHARRHLQRPRRAAHGLDRIAVRAQRAALLHVPRGAARAARPQPAADQPAAPDPGEVPAGHDAQPARGRVDPVRGPRLVQPRRQRPDAALGDPGRGRRSVARPSDAHRPHAARSEHRAGQAGDVHDARHPLVGRLAGVRQHAGVRRRAPDARARQAEARRAGPASGGRRAEHRPQGRRRQLLDRTRPAALAVHARAQRGLRPAARRVPRDDRPAAVREGTARRRRADGEDPHGRLDAGDHRPSDDRPRAPDELVRPARRALRQARRTRDEQRGDPRHPGLADEPPRRALLADRGVRRRLPDAPADPRRLRVPVAARRLGDPAPRADRGGCAGGARTA